MKKKATTLLSMLAIFTGLLQAQVIFDPATYPVDSLPAGMEIVDMDGTMYLKAALNGWDSYLRVWDVEIAPGHTRFHTKVMYKEGSSGYTMDKVNTFLKLSTPDWTELIANGTASMAEVHHRTIDGLKGGDQVGIFQFAGQETETWGAVVDDTLFIGKVVAENPSAFLDPLLVTQDMLPSGWTIDTIEGEAYFQVILNGWNSTWEFHKNMDSVTVPVNVNAIKAMAKYAVGASGFELANINTFIKFSDPGWNEVVAMTSASSTEFKKYNKALAAGSTLGVFQVAGQETTGWSAVTGDTLWVGILMAEMADSIKISSEGDATSIDTNMGTLQLTATLYPGDLAVPSVTWSSSDPEIATVDDNGLVSAVSNGEVTITASGGEGINDEFMITVSNQVTLIESITVAAEGEATTIETAGGTLQMSATVLPEEADESMFEWSLAPEGLASIDAAGLLTAIANGVVTVTATATDGSDVSGSTDITITGQNTGLNKVETTSLVFYPNPVINTLNLEQAGNLRSIEILDVNGKLLMRTTEISDEMTLDVSSFASGIYFIRTLEDEEIRTFKFVK